MQTILAFILAVGILVAVHEWGHFAMARACGVRVLRFSVGMGPRVAGWTSARSGTEFVLGLLPIGGYVRMLDETEEPVAPEDLAFAFNRKPLRSRAAIVLAGPMANLVLAVILYAGVNWAGVQQAAAVVGKPVAGSFAARAGFVGGEVIRRAGNPGDEPEAVASFDDFRWRATRAALARQDLDIYFVPLGKDREVRVTLELSGFTAGEVDSALLRTIGFLNVYTPAQLGELSPDGAARSAGLLPGDLVARVDGQEIADAGQLRELIRASGALQSPAPQSWEVVRDHQLRTIRVRPLRVHEGSSSFGRVGAVIGAQPAMVPVRYGLVAGLKKAVETTWDVSALTLRTMALMVAGEASLKNLSGPITIADYAGKSAALGPASFAVFLALISVSLGVLNLLPLPVLDGGHLMYYLWESLTGRAVNELWTQRLQRVGLAVLLLMMSVAVFNDVSRLVGSA